ncbi:MAG: alanine dehydrogenase [Spirochaetales bacterium]|nr:MAG: alanine dehydrogenase [Spirochaetales bacterium]
MIIGMPKEIKNNEYRCAATPGTLAELVRNGHKVLVERGAGIGSSFSDDDFVRAGAIVTDRDTVYKDCDLLYKVKEIMQPEFKYLRKGMTIFTYLHSNAHREMTDALLSAGCVGIAYEDITDNAGTFPLLRPMSELAGKGGFFMACQHLQSINGGNGLMMTRVSGIRTPEVTIIGAGNAGLGVAEMAANLGNYVTLLDVSFERMESAKYRLPSNVQFLYSNKENLQRCLKRSDVIFNCILWPKTRKDHLVTREMLKDLKPDCMIVDVACDDAGAIETCRSTSHDNPTYREEGILHYCVDNIPSAFSCTATASLASATLPYAMELANKGPVRALKENPHLRRGLTCFNGILTLEETGLKQARPFKKPEEIPELMDANRDVL